MSNWKTYLILYDIYIYFRVRIFPNFFFLVFFGKSFLASFFPFLWLMHCACKFDAGLWESGRKSGRGYALDGDGKLKQPARGFPRGSVENEKDDSLLPAILTAILPACHAKCAKLTLLLRALTVALRPKGMDLGGRGRRGAAIANDEWKMCGKLLRQNSEWEWPSAATSWKRNCEILVEIIIN